MWMWVDASSEELLACRIGIFSKAVIEKTRSITKSGTPVCLAHRVNLNILQIVTPGKPQVENILHRERVGLDPASLDSQYLSIGGGVFRWHAPSTPWTNNVVDWI